jgi:ABC-type transporter Mla MlaB component
MVEAAGSCADRAERQKAGSDDAASCPHSAERSAAGTDENGSDGPARLSVVLETAAHEAALILSGRLDTGSLVAFEVAIEQLALTPLLSVRVDVRALTAVDRAGLCSLMAFGRWARDRGMTLRVETGGPSGSSALGLVLGVALGKVGLAEHMTRPIVPVATSRPRRASVHERALASWEA